MFVLGIREIRGQLSRGKSSGGNFLGGDCPAGNCRRENCPNTLKISFEARLLKMIVT